MGASGRSPEVMDFKHTFYMNHHTNISGKLLVNSHILYKKIFAVKTKNEHIYLGISKNEV